MPDLQDIVYQMHHPKQINSSTANNSTEGEVLAIKMNVTSNLSILGDTDGSTLKTEVVVALSCTIVFSLSSPSLSVFFRFFRLLGGMSNFPLPKGVIVRTCEEVMPEVVGVLEYDKKMPLSTFRLRNIFSSNLSIITFNIFSNHGEKIRRKI